jgi:discoidin domain receptor family protein 2
LLAAFTLTDAVVSYTMPQGERRGSEVDLYDFTYDGSLEDGLLSGGLGQLTDGAEGQSNFRLDPDNLGIKGYEWIGWKNDTHGPNPVEITFKFDQPRNFSAINIHTNNMFSKDVRTFRRANISFSIGGQYFLGERHVFNYMRDIIVEYARPVIIPLPPRVGRFVKIQLEFDAKWLMISEVGFDSVPAVGHFPLEVPPATDPPPTSRPIHTFGISPS